MTEPDDVERVLSRYRPSAPSAALRQRVILSQRSGGSHMSVAIRWTAAAAAVFAAVLLHWQASRTFNAIVQPAAGSAAHARAEAIHDMTELMGGDDLARQAAERWYDAARTTAAAHVRPDQETTWIQ